MKLEYAMKRPVWALIIGIFAILIGIVNGWIAMIDLSLAKSWEGLNAMFAPAQQIITEQGADAANFAFGMIAPPAWFVNVTVTVGWAGIGTGILFLVAGIGLIMYRRFGMWLLALALTANTILQVIYSVQAVRSMSMQAVIIPSRTIWVIAVNILLLLVIGIGSLRWFRFTKPVAVSANGSPAISS
jgi:hypothetical protein